MKNFSAKNAEFETLKINNEAAISSADLGTAPNQIPLNKDLGSLAYQDAVNLDDVSADMLELRAIAAEISDSAVDVFVYDTSRDSDGGAWRKRTQHTSWYNEELNTATRGGRREFPAVAVIVAEAKKVTIYDGDDPDLSMWMVFENLATFSFVRNNLSSVFASNGQLCIGNNAGLSIARFANDSGYSYFTSERRTWSSVIATRTELTYDGANDTSIVIVNNTINDVAMTILPNAPIDNDTGLPVPTIAVATDDGVSVIKDDGSVVDLLSPYTGFGNITEISFSSDGRLHFNMYDENRPGRYFMIAGIPDKDETLQMSFEPNGDSFNKLYILEPGAQSYSTTIPKALNDNFAEKIQVLSDSRNALGSPTGLTFLDYNKNIMPSVNEYAEGMVAYTTSKYNTGWMPGDIKLATLSDTTVETIGTNSDELVTNGHFSTDSDWTKENGWTISGGQAVANASASSTLYQTLTFEIGKTYVITMDVVEYTSGSVSLRVGTTSETYSYKTSTGTYSRVFTATAQSMIVGAIVDGGSNLVIDNVSVRATTELITNGDFSNGTTGWDQNDADSFTVNSLNQAVITSNTGSTWQTVYQGISTVIGKKYTASVDVVGNTNLVDLWVGTSGDGSFSERSNLGPLDGNINGTGRFSATFIATTTTTFINLAVYNGIGTFDNVSVRPAEEDRSVNNNGLQIVGEINKTPVATGADLVAYSGFSEYNYLVQPYNEDLNFGTGDFCVMGWVRTSISSSDYQTILDFGLTATGSRRHLAIAKDTGELYMAIQDSNTIGTHSVSVANNSWCHFVATVVDGTISFYINGIFAGSNSSLTLNNLDDSIGLRVGLGIDDQFILNGSVSLLRVSATAPTDAQIAKIYRDEKALFQDGAQATLYGTSDAVTALAYDDSNQLLHVGTASGRSDFRGLVRVNNTTTAISNSISAAEGTIIQN